VGHEDETARGLLRNRVGGSSSSARATWYWRRRTRSRYSPRHRFVGPRARAPSLVSAAWAAAVAGSPASMVNRSWKRPIPSSSCTSAGGSFARKRSVSRFASACEGGRRRQRTPGLRDKWPRCRLPALAQHRAHRCYAARSPSNALKADSTAQSLGVSRGARLQGGRYGRPPYQRPPISTTCPSRSRQRR
jgi:hypothetical protein